MRTVPSWSIVLAAAFVVPTACSTRTAQGGLTNAPATNRPWGPEDRGQDVISNGPGSCPSSGKAEDDPLKNRQPPCSEQGVGPQGTPAAPAKTAAPPSKP